MKGLDWGIVRQPRVPRCWKVWASDAARWPGQGRLSSRGPEGWRASNPLPAQPHSLGAKGLHDHSIFSMKQLISDQIKSQGTFLILCFNNATCSEGNTPEFELLSNHFLNLSISWRCHLRNFTGRPIKMTKACVNVILAVKTEISRQLGRQG